MPDNKKKFTICMIGPHFKTPGGISTVLNIYKDSFEDRFNLVFIPTYSGYGRIKDLSFFLYSLVALFVGCIISRNVVYHIHMASDGSFLRKYLLSRICSYYRKKFVVHIHGGEFNRFIEKSSEYRKRCILRMLNEADKVIVLSEGWKLYFSKYMHLDKLLCIYNPAAVLKSHDRTTKDNQVQVCFVGRLGKGKGIFDLVDAVKRIEEIGFIVHLYGDGQVEQVKSYIEKLKLEKKFMIHGWVNHEHMGQVYRNSDIVVLPSYAEGLPMSVLEGMAKGLPVIATPVGGIPEAVYEGENGFLVEPGNIDALADCLQRLVNDSELRARMGVRSLEIVAEKFSVEAVGCKLKALYDELQFDR